MAASSSGWLRPVWEPASAAALCIVVAVVYSRLFIGHHALWLLGGAALIPAAVVGILRVRTARSTTLVLITAAVALVVFIVEAALFSHTGHGLPGQAAWSAFGRGIHDGWRQLLTVGLPAPPTGVLEVTPLILVGAASAVSAILATERGTILAPIVPPLLALAIGLGFAAGGPSFPGLSFAVAFVAVAALLAATRSRSMTIDPVGPSRSPQRELSDADADWAPIDMAVAPANAGSPAATATRLGLAVPAVVVVTVLALGVTSALPVASANHRLDPRRWVKAPVHTTQQVSPLVELNALAQLRPAVTLFTVRVQGSAGTPKPNQLRVAALNVYNGAEWTSDGQFQLSGSQLPVGSAAGHTASHLIVDVAVDSPTAELLGPYLPATGTPTTMVITTPGRQFAVDPRDDQLLALGTLTGLRYRLSATAVPAGSTASLDAAYAADNEGLAAFGALPTDPQVRQEIQGWADQMTTGATTPAEQLKDLQAGLRRLAASPQAAPGDSWGEIDQILARKRAGNAAQLATAFTLLARAKGFPARVAVGYRLASTQPPSSTYQVTSADASAWPEVDLTGLGWVAFNPVGTKTTRIEPPSKTKSVKTQPVQTQPSIPTQVQPNGSSGNAPGSNGEGQAGKGAGVGDVARDGSLAALALLALAGPPAGVVALKSLRRRRRSRAASPSERVLGAWSEVRDRLLEQRLSVAPSWSPLELALAVDRHFEPTPPTSVNALAPLVTSTLFAPAPPDEDEADRSWELAGLFGEELRHSGRVSRWRALLDPRPLLPNRAVRLPAPEVA